MTPPFVEDIEHYAIFRLDSEGRVATWNEGAERIKGYAEDEVLGTHYRTFFLPEAVERGTPEQLLARAETEGAIKGRGWRVRKDDRRFWADFSLTALFDESGDLRGFAKVVQDATAQREYEQRLERRTERLEEFADQVSHDLKNPLNVARGHVELAREELDSPDLETAATAIERCFTTIDDLLALAQSEESAEAAEEVALPEMVTWCWQTVEATTETLVVETEATIVAVPTRLRQILDNLLANAVAHGGEGTTVTVGDLEDGFYVADSGVGIPEAERERVFEKGYSGGEGSGLGLHLVREHVTAQGWEIAVTESATGGARFEITGVDVVE